MIRQKARHVDKHDGEVIKISSDADGESGGDRRHLQPVICSSAKAEIQAIDPPRETAIGDITSITARYPDPATSN
jgi:hypothetical protein